MRTNEQNFEYGDYVYYPKLDPSRNKYFKITNYLSNGFVHLVSTYNGSRYDAHESELELIIDNEAEIKAIEQEARWFNDLHGTD